MHTSLGVCRVHRRTNVGDGCRTFIGEHGLVVVELQSRGRRATPRRKKDEGIIHFFRFIHISSGATADHLSPPQIQARLVIPGLR